MQIVKKKVSSRLTQWIQSWTWKGSHNTPGVCVDGSYKTSPPCYGGGDFSEKNKLFKALDDQSIGTGPQRYTFTERFLKDNGKATVNQAVQDIFIHTVDNFTKALIAMTKHAFPSYAVREQKRHLRRHLINMKPCFFISGQQQLNA